MPKKTPQEIAAEIAALKALKPVGQFKRKTAETIALQIEALEGKIDETSDEFNVELTDEQQMSAMDAINWVNGDADAKPSGDWGALVE